MSENVYIHGTENEEQDRLATLNNMTNKSFLDFIEFRETDKVLDVGSGLGLLAKEVALKIPDGKVTGLEKSEEQLKLCPASVSNLTFIKGDAHNMPFDDNSFNVVYCRYILEHVANPLKVLNEVLV